MSARVPGTLDGMTAARGQRFVYEEFTVDPGANRVVCRYTLDDFRFEERVTFPAGGDWSHPAAAEAARLVFLTAGVSYYKAAAPPVIDLGAHGLTPAERRFLHAFYVDGLGEFAYRNKLDLTGVRIEAPDRHPPAAGAASYRPPPGRPLVPFGGGLDSIVTVDLVAHRSTAVEPALFVAAKGGDRFDAIEAPAALTGLPVVRAERDLDPQVLRSRELGFLNGHVPVTGILSAIAVTAAVLGGHDAVIMSNERSASDATLEHNGRAINHQWSKSIQFEGLFRDVVAGAVGGLEYFSLLRPRSELWIARHFADLDADPSRVAARPVLEVFRSCNRAFHLDPAQRLDRWCGECDKCVFVDLVLAPFVPADRLRAVFAGAEPIEDPARRPQLEALLGTSADAKPFECVGDVDECRAALHLAARRPDRSGAGLLQELAATTPPPALSTEALLAPLGDHFVPPAYAPDDLVG